MKVKYKVLFSMCNVRIQQKALKDILNNIGVIIRYGHNGSIGYICA